MRHRLAIAFLIACSACTTSLAYPEDETQVATFILNNATSRDAATVLRTIVAIKKLELPDDHTITVRDTPEQLELATAVVKMLDASEDTTDTTPLPAGDGAIIVAVALNRASAGDVMAALRTELRIARIASVGEKRLFLRDTDGQIMAALKVIERLEGSHEAPETR